VTAGTAERRRFSSFEEFWPFYVSQHSKKATRWLHFAGTAGAAGIVGAAILRRRPETAAVAPLFAYGLAWFSHAVIEKNIPATFSHPLWSLRADFRMFARMLAGRMDVEVARLLAADTLATP
jgi:hypothetical protein